MAVSANNNLLQSPMVASTTYILSPKRPSISPLKRKLCDASETLSPMAMAGVPEHRVISPRKMAKRSDKTVNMNTTRPSMSWSSALMLGVNQLDSGDVSASSMPIAWADEPVTALDETILDILDYLLA